jgi:hypothetical protein
MSITRKSMVLAVLSLFVVGALAFIQATPAAATGPTPVPDNPNCADLGYGFGFKINEAPNGKFYFTSTHGELTSGAPEDPNNYVIVSNSDGVFFDWTSSLGIDAVIVKGGKEGANLYEYDPEATGDEGLTTPTSQDISHIEFCYDYEVDVSKDVHTSFTRTYNWDITKDPDGEYSMFAGDSTTHGYTVSVDQTGFSDSDWAVAGTITIENNTPFDARIESVSDEISGFGSVSVDCVVEVPYDLPAGQTLICSYSTPLPDGSNRTNTALATTSGIVGGGEATVDVVFGAPTTEVNKEINVTDTNGQSWGPVSGDTTWTYDKTFTCSSDPTDYVDGHYMFTKDNTASIDETDQSADASVTVHCYAPVVSKDAHTSFTRTWSWTIDKMADQTDLTLSPGQQFQVNYQVTVDATYADSDWAVAGTITVQNPNPEAEMTVSLKDMVDGTEATLACGGSLTVPAGGSATCGYSAGLLDGSDRTNTATAALNDIDFTGTADVTFDLDNPTEEKDECIDVSDSYAEALGTVCYGVDTLPQTFTYDRWIGPYNVCGDYTVENTVSFVTNDTGATGSDSWTVNVNVPCAGGCTLTQGYWKTHSKYGPAPYDDTWDLRDGGDAPFFGTGKSYYQILWTVPKGGNAYYILAHQYIAAELNQLNGADVPVEVQIAMGQAETLLIQYQDDLSIPKKGGDRELAISLYELLDAYNNGYIGPGHCSE